MFTENRSSGPFSLYRKGPERGIGMDSKPREGDVYKVLTAFGKSFTLRYGYYEERERESKWAEPMPIYPDFLKDPTYTEVGEPFVTGQFVGKNREDGCFGCEYYRKGDEFLGICVCIRNRKNE